MSSAAKIGVVAIVLLLIVLAVSTTQRILGSIYTIVVNCGTTDVDVTSGNERYQLRAKDWVLRRSLPKRITYQAKVNGGSASHVVDLVGQEATLAQREPAVIHVVLLNTGKPEPVALTQ